MNERAPKLRRLLRLLRGRRARHWCRGLYRVMVRGGRKLVGRTGEICEESGLYRCQKDAHATRVEEGDIFPRCNEGECDTIWVRVGG